MRSGEVEKYRPVRVGTKEARAVLAAVLSHALLANGRTNPQIGEILFIREKTARVGLAG